MKVEITVALPVWNSEAIAWLAMEGLCNQVHPGVGWELIIMEEVEHAWWRSLGLSVHAPDDDGATSWPRVSTHCDYTAPVRFEDELELSLGVADVSDKSLNVVVEFRRGGRCVATGSMRSVCCRMEAGAFRAVDIPPAIREKLLAARAVSASAGADSEKAR